MTDGPFSPVRASGPGAAPASRLERLNERFGTGILAGILAAHSTAALAGDVPVVRLFVRPGAVDVRGKSAPVTVYTLAA